MTTQAAQPERSVSMAGLARALTDLRDTLGAVIFPLEVPGAEIARHALVTTSGQLDDYLLPRLGRLDAAVLVVVGGSTGAGKSTLVNSLVRAPVSEAGVLRPTTRAPVLVCHPDDTTWFTGANVLPHLARSRTVDVATTLRIEASPSLTAGLALLDAPDIDSVVDSNRALAEQLLAAADLWLFVTTAARYADAVPWEVLRTARQRGTAIALILDRVPAGAGDEIAPHLVEMLTGHDLTGTPLFVIGEEILDDRGLLSESAVAPLREWLARLASSAATRAAVIRQTVDGAIAALAPTLRDLAGAGDEQVTAARWLLSTVDSAYDAAEDAVRRGIVDGQVLHGEVLARWQELVGTGQFMRGLQARIGRLRDRLAAAVTGRPATDEQFAEALESGLSTLVRAAVTDAAEQASTAWRAHPAGSALLAEHPALRSPGVDLTPHVARLVRDWQRSVLDLVRAEAGNKRYVAKVGAYAVNALGLLVMIAVFTATSFIPTGAEVVVAGGTTIAAQKLLEAIFGDQAVRALAEQARIDLLARVRVLLNADAARFRDALDATGVDLDVPGRLRQAAAAVQEARRSSPLPAGASIPKPSRGWRR